MAVHNNQALSVEAVAQATRQARRDGTFAGLSSGLVSAILGSKVFRLNRNATILCGVATGIISGYQFTQGFLATNIARLDAEKARLDNLAAQQDQNVSTTF
ncbi:hypothetical protein V8D89_011975 [Ganoderma adspersum]